MATLAFRSTFRAWHKFICRLALVDAGVGQTGLSPVVSVFRHSDSTYLQDDGSWDVAFNTLDMVEFDSVNMPGYYQYSIPSDSLDYYEGGDGGFLVKYYESTLPYLDYEFSTQMPSSLPELSSGYVAAGASNTVTLATTSSAVAQFYRGQEVTIIDGTGAGQTRIISNYTTGRVATVYPAWATVPDTTSQYVISGIPDFGAAVWRSDLDALMGASGGLMLPATAETIQNTAGAALQLVTESSVQGFATASDGWVNHFVSSGAGTTSKFYFDSALGPAVAASGNWAGKLGVVIVASTGVRRMVKVTGVATDGAVHFTLSLLDGSVLPITPSAGDRLVVLQGPAVSITDIFTASMSPYETAGTFGNHVNRMLRLRQENVRVVYTDWATNGQPIEGYVLTYASASDLTSDEGPTWALAKARHDFTATYDEDLQLTGYASVKTT